MTLAAVCELICCCVGIDHVDTDHSICRPIRRSRQEGKKEASEVKIYGEFIQLNILTVCQ